MLAPSPELLIFLAALESRRDQKGTEWCRRHGIGAARMRLNAATVVPITTDPATATMFLANRHRAAEMLACACRSCGGCRMAKL